MDYRDILGLLAVAAGISGYVPYFRDIFRDRTKPHAFSWLVWGVIEAIIFVIQVIEKAGAGAWVGGFTSLICFSIGLIALYKGSRQFSKLDWISLGGAVIAIVSWVLTENPLNAVILLVITDAIAFSITYRKSFDNPYEETPISYIFAGLKSLIAIFALENFILTNWLFLGYLTIANFAFVGMCLARRKQKRLAE